MNRFSFSPAHTIVPGKASKLGDCISNQRVIVEQQANHSLTLFLVNILDQSKDQLLGFVITYSTIANFSSLSQKLTVRGNVQ